MGFGFAILYVWLARPTQWSIIVGGIVLAPGLILRAFASGHVQKNSTLTTSGPYAYTRNPLYLGSLILALGFAIAGRSWWIAGIMAIMFFAIYLPVIAAEERFLHQTFAEFSDYVRYVPRLWPRWTPYSNQRGKFSLELYRNHREYNALLGSLLLLGILVLKTVKPLW